MQKKRIASHQKTLLGAHISGAGTLHDALLVGNEIGCTTIQIFTKSNRQWSFNLIDQDEVELFLKTQKSTNIEVVVSHAGYLINLCSPKKDIFKKSLKGLMAELKRCQQLNIPYLVLHPGSRLDSPEAAAMKQLASGIDEIFESFNGSTILLLENMAGQGSSIGATFEQLAEIRKMICHKKQVGFCLDTCHAFAAGYSFDTKECYATFLKKLDSTIGLNNLFCFHLNDSMKAINSHVDRHEWIGKGHIGLEAFSLFMNDPQFRKIPKIIETPLESIKDHIHNLTILRNLIKK